MYTKTIVYSNFRSACLSYSSCFCCRKLRRTLKLGQKATSELPKHCVLHSTNQIFQKVWYRTRKLPVTFSVFILLYICCMLVVVLGWPVPDVLCWNSGTVCFASGKPAKTWSFWGRSYWPSPRVIDLYAWSRNTSAKLGSIYSWKTNAWVCPLVRVMFWEPN
jgi:hypothetical protein